MRWRITSSHVHHKRMGRIVRSWIPVFVIASLIFCFSSQPYKKQDMRPLLSSYLNEQHVEQAFSDVTFTYAGNEVSVENKGSAGFVEFLVRKGAHLGIYALLGIFLYHALRQTCSVRFLPLLSLCMLALYAATDEAHQWLVGDRTPLYQDVLLDTIGGFMGMCAYYGIYAVSRGMRAGRA